ncbi:uncharacterized protein J7T54_001482 [Emericellopsis cladophorae]|uniref:Phytocyanin domain-containing protein n=1 Tax=Emericellopsis cladophorae TaxID=2686198 RepID=A0A9Q0BEE4_9HYPO|nr:uncharacterized protein J7T54_001482 [Emericellopsis cladophorae]KAI6781520.1 hypothetical protein J7T54_001482 [Emericellopsis cladophorae]
MKFGTALALGIAPAAMAAKVRNTYPPARRAWDYGLNARDGHLPAEAGHEPAHEPAVGEHVSNEDQWHWPEEVAVGKQTEVIIIWQHPGGEGHETVKYHDKVTVTETVTATAHPGAAPTEMPVAHPPEAAATHTVTVGGPNGLVYEPESLHNVPVGDMVIFEYLAQNHTVTQSTFDLPCDPLAGGMDTGHQPNPDNSIVPPPQVAMQVTTGDPLWFYCKTGTHCSAGMVFSINPTEEKSQAIFKEKAMNTDQGEGAAPPATPPPAESGTPAEPPAEEAPAEEAPAEEAPAEGDANLTPGKGYVGEDGSCVCMVTCSAWGFPDSKAQGVGATGGMAGSMPVKMAGLR